MSDSTNNIENKRLSAKRSAFYALCLLVPVPSLGVIAAMHLNLGNIGQFVFFLSKFWILAFPVLWLVCHDRIKPTLPRATTKGMSAAVISGLLIVLVIAGVFLEVNNLGLIDANFLATTIKANGLSTPTIYLIAAIYWCTINSLLEEYVWRWFVFTKCELVFPKLIAVFASGIFFTLHHIFALAAYFSPLLTFLASLGVLTGGAIWSWIYLRYRNIYAAYVSHVFADLIIFYIGYQLIFK